MRAAATAKSLETLSSALLCLLADMRVVHGSLETGRNALRVLVVCEGAPSNASGINVY